MITLPGVGEAVLVAGDNRETLRLLPDCSVDAVVTDPPYGLNKAPNMDEVLRHWLAGDDFAASGSGFMGKGWDSFVPGPATWREVFRVLKPGGHVLMFGGTRMWDVATLALRLAGFEVRDTLMWVYGSGMPKSHDVSKAIDKLHGATREVIGTKKGVKADPSTGRNDMPGKTVGVKQIVTDVPVTAPATEDAVRWDGWGTALKPAWEPIVLARKPLEGSVASNVLTYGTGGINIDDCRIGSPAGEGLGRWPANVLLTHSEGCQRVGESVERVGGGAKMSKTGQANVEFGGGYERGDGWTGSEVVSELWECSNGCPVRLLDDQSGDRPSAKSPSSAVGAESIFRPGQGGYQKQGPIYADSGGASRYFHSSEPDESGDWECDEDCPVRLLDDQSGVTTSGAMRNDVDAYPGESATSLPRGRSGPGNQRADSGGASRFFYSGKVTKTERHAGMPDGVINDHPTVKPSELMAYLIRLVCPPGGLVLDPFCGSGSTGLGAAKEGAAFVGLDLTPEYVEIARHRLAHAGLDALAV
jgi:DNA modification methylase